MNTYTVGTWSRRTLWQYRHTTAPDDAARDTDVHKF